MRSGATGPPAARWTLLDRAGERTSQRSGLVWNRRGSPTRRAGMSSGRCGLLLHRGRHSGAAPSPRVASRVLVASPRRRRRSRTPGRARRARPTAAMTPRRAAAAERSARRRRAGRDTEGVTADATDCAGGEPGAGRRRPARRGRGLLRLRRHRSRPGSRTASGSVSVPEALSLAARCAGAPVPATGPYGRLAECGTWAVRTWEDARDEPTSSRSPPTRGRTSSRSPSTAPSV